VSIRGAQLYERWRRALRVRQSGADLKPPQAAAAKEPWWWALRKRRDEIPSGQGWERRAASR